MPNMWVQLTAIYREERNGQTRTHHKGDRIYLSQYHALKLINTGVAIPLDSVLTTTEIVGGSCGIVTKNAEAVKAIVKDKVEVVVPGKLSFQRTLYLDSPEYFRFDLLAAGFKIIEKWQCAAPLWSYTELAETVGTEAERNWTRTVIKDLRVPMYDTRVVFVRDCRDMRKFMALWEKEQVGGGDNRLSFLRALYQVKPTICALPSAWSGRGE